MNLTFNGPTDALFWVAATWGIVVTLFWMRVAWRAMRAHEQLAAAAHATAKTQVQRPLPRVEEGPLR